MTVIGCDKVLCYILNTRSIADCWSHESEVNVRWRRTWPVSLQRENRRRETETVKMEREARLWHFYTRQSWSGRPDQTFVKGISNASSSVSPVLWLGMGWAFLQCLFFNHTVCLLVFLCCADRPPRGWQREEGQQPESLQLHHWPNLYRRLAVRCHMSSLPVSQSVCLRVI